MNRKSTWMPAALLASLSFAAHAADAPINSQQLSLATVAGHATINVYSSDGEQWDTIAGPPLKLQGYASIDTRYPGWVNDWAVFVGFCESTGCGGKPMLFSRYSGARDVDVHFDAELPMSEIPVTTNGTPVIPLGDNILAACNEHLSGVYGANTDQALLMYVPVTLSADTLKSVLPPLDSSGGGSESPDFLGGDSNSHHTFLANVQCHGYDDGIDFDDVPNPDAQIQNLELFLSTFSDAYTEPEEGIRCKQGRIRVRVTTTEAGPVAFRLWTQGPDLLADQYVEAWSSHVGSGVYEAVFDRWVTTSETTELYALVEAGDGQSGLVAGWEQLTLECIEDTPDLYYGDPEPDGGSRGPSDWLRP